jgi:hypothetical protein
MACCRENFTFTLPFTHKTLSLTLTILFKRFFKYKIKVETKAHLCFFKKVGGAVGVHMEPRGRRTENVWEPLVYMKTYLPSSNTARIPRNSAPE